MAEEAEAPGRSGEKEEELGVAALPSAGAVGDALAGATGPEMDCGVCT